MAIRTHQVLVAPPRPVLLTSSSSDSVSGSAILVRNRGATPLFIGPEDVDETCGYELLAGESVAMNLDTGEELYGFTVGEPVRCDVLEQGV